MEREGVTLYAVGAEAGLPKGGLLYHFASREDLVQAIHQHLTDQYVLMPQSFGAWHPLLGFVRARRGTDEP